jgi:hypothetical protein
MGFSEKISHKGTLNGRGYICITMSEEGLFDRAMGRSYRVTVLTELLKRNQLRK